MKAITVVFPNTRNILCIWHVNMNLIKKARPILKDQLANARRNGLTTLDEITLPPATTRMSKKELNDTLNKVEEEGWSKMIKQ